MTDRKGQMLISACERPALRRTRNIWELSTRFKGGMLRGACVMGQDRTLRQ